MNGDHATSSIRSTETESPNWETRFRAPRYTLPAWAKEKPDRCVFVSDLPGIAQVYCWDRASRAVRQVTDCAHGARHCAVEASGQGVWWFADTNGDEYGQWMRQPFTGGADMPVAPTLGPSWQAGLAIGLRGHVLLGRSTEDGTYIHLLRPGAAPQLLYRHEEPAYALDLSRALDLVVIAHSESGDLWRPGVRVLRLDGTTVADLGSDDEAVESVGFAPVVGDSRLLLLHQRDGRLQPLICDPFTGQRTEIHLNLPGEIEVEWFQDAHALLIQHNHHARSSLLRYDLAKGTITALDTPAGTIEHTRTRPDGDVWLLWSSSAHQPRFTSLTGNVGFPLLSPRSAAVESTPVQDAWVEGPGGPVHALVSAPDAVSAPYPTVFLLHGGPDDHDRDAFDPVAAAWVDHGFAVIRVNYRGSTGYGTAWMEALRNKVGFTELEDIAAVRRWAVDTQLVDPQRVVLAGWSWGGYLTLLGLGLHPENWTVGLAGAPVADCVTAHADAMEDIKALDRTLFGGSPQEVPDRYHESSPMTYVDSVAAPVLLSAGVNDARCPIGQVDAYVARLAELGKPHQFHRYASGHSTTDVDERVQMFRHQLEFVKAHLATISTTP